MNYFSICLFIFAAYITDASIIDERDALLREEARFILGGKTKLTFKEELVNICLMNYKHEELDYGMKNPTDYNFSYHYFAYKDDIQNSKVYRMLKDMPKGAALHIHDMAILGPDYLVQLTYLNDLYMCDEGESLKLKFSSNIPNDTCREWRLVSEARDSSHNVTEFDSNLRKQFTLVDCDLGDKYPDINHVWDAFMTYYFKVESLLTYKPVWEQYFYDCLKAFREENILYVEVRSVLPFLYDLDGTLHKPFTAAECYQNVISRFVKDYPDFIGAKVIYTPLRQVDSEKLNTYIKQGEELKSQFPDLIIGFDLFGLEDLGSPLVENLEKLSTADLNFFFHAGETNWLGSAADENLVDAILLGSKRIGHALNLAKHPVLMEEVISRNIAIEVNVISNIVFYLVKDAREHPFSYFISSGVPVVLSSDAPGAWEADLLSFDFYVAFVGATSRHNDLRLLKALAINSLVYSAMNRTEKIKAISVFKKKWHKFVDEFDCSRYNPGTITLLCRKNEKQNRYCVQFTEALSQLKSPNDSNAVEILNSIARRLEN